MFVLGATKTKHKVEAENLALRKFWAPNRAWGASGATGYLLIPKKLGEEGVVVGMSLVPPT